MRNSQNALSQQLTWTRPPTNILVIKKECNNIFESFTSIISYLIQHHHITVFIEDKAYANDLLSTDQQITEFKTNGTLKKFLPYIDFNECWAHPVCFNLNGDNDSTNQIDLVICLGGDGTLLHASTLFQQSCPPVLSIHMESLGFLCPFGFDSYKEYITSILKGNFPIIRHSRLRFKFEKSIETLLDNSINVMTNNENQTTDNNLPLEWLSLNEVVISRGQSSFICNLDLYINDYLITTVQGDGLIISTPTGSTAYAMAAGASMCHPSVPSIIIAPICPHSLSFRPIVVPADVELKIQLSNEARHTATFSVDGRANHELKRGYQICITTSEFPLPSICRNGQLNDWFEGLAMCLNWNQRQKQLPLNSCYLSSPISKSFSEANSLVNQSSDPLFTKRINKVINSNSDVTNNSNN